MHIAIYQEFYQKHPKDIPSIQANPTAQTDYGPPFFPHLFCTCDCKAKSCAWCKAAIALGSTDDSPRPPCSWVLGGYGVLKSLEGIETGLDPVGLIKVDKNTYEWRNLFNTLSNCRGGMTSLFNLLFFREWPRSPTPHLSLLWSQHDPAMLWYFWLIISVLHEKHKMPTSFFRTLFSKFSYPILSAEHDVFHKRGNAPTLPFMSVDKSDCSYSYMHVRDHCNIKQLWYARTQTTIMKKTCLCFTTVLLTTLWCNSHLWWDPVRFGGIDSSCGSRRNLCTYIYLPETNMASETMASQKEKHLPTINFGAMLVSGRVKAFFSLTKLLFQIASTILYYSLHLRIWDQVSVFKGSSRLSQHIASKQTNMSNKRVF